MWYEVLVWIGMMLRTFDSSFDDCESFDLMFVCVFLLDIQHRLTKDRLNQRGQCSKGLFFHTYCVELCHIDELRWVYTVDNWGTCVQNFDEIGPVGPSKMLAYDVNHAGWPRVNELIVVLLYQFTSKGGWNINVERGGWMTAVFIFVERRFVFM